jgi:starvation-inducible outer membrane lipoprotein
MKLNARLALLILLSVLLTACVTPGKPTANPNTNTCPHVNTLSPDAFQKFQPGTCITLVPPAEREPRRYA